MRTEGNIGRLPQARYWAGLLRTSHRRHGSVSSAELETAAGDLAAKVGDEAQAAQFRQHVSARIANETIHD